MLRLTTISAPVAITVMICGVSLLSGCLKDDKTPSQPEQAQQQTTQLDKFGAFLFVGFSTVTVNGSGDDGVKPTRGLGGMYAACKANPKFGPTSRMCTSKEFSLSPNATLPSADAWLQPVARFTAPKYFPGPQTGNACRSTSSNILNWASERTKGLTLSVDDA